MTARDERFSIMYDGVFYCLFLDCHFLVSFVLWSGLIIRAFGHRSNEYLVIGYEEKKYLIYVAYLYARFAHHNRYHARASFVVAASSEETIENT